MVYFGKTKATPDCLEAEKKKKAGDYKCGNVLEKLRSDFKNKCYICEQKEPITINVEHLRPHQGNVDLKFDWNNLFWSCGHCNNIKSNKYDDIINCTNRSENIEQRIKISLVSFPKEEVVVESLDGQTSTISTVALLNAVYNGTTSLKKIESANLRSKVLMEVTSFLDELTNYYDKDIDTELKQYYYESIIKNLTNSSAFTAFKRWKILENEVMKSDFGEFV